MRFVLFYHSFVSCWNHGNAHFLRGMARALVSRGHSVATYEPIDGWSRQNALLEEGGAQAVAECARLVPGVEVHFYRPETLDLDRALDHADVVVAHEWNDPALIARLGARRRGGHFVLLFHDTHHRAVSAPEELDRFELDAFDAVLVFGEVLREVYLRRGWGRRAVTWHEAADAALFRPRPSIEKGTDLIWIGNWGDGERDAELQRFLIEPVLTAGLAAQLHGVRYPVAVQDKLRADGFSLGGWLPNHRAPAAFAAARFTIHVPRRPYVAALPGIPTIRVFEALACGIPLISAPWTDAENLFPAGSYLKARDGAEVVAAMRALVLDPSFAEEVSGAGLAAIEARHTCEHRADELMAVIAGLTTPARVPAASPIQAHHGAAQ
ncbi:MAG TPA: glycosyltransferase [Xanthobacteraceae bacterium]|nr:glycosyltransferase [Xanthobacteraceae bacterium]